MKLQKGQLTLINEPLFTAGDGKHAFFIQIPFEHGKVEYRFLHCRKDSLNTDNWRLHEVCLLEQGASPSMLTERGEWELAVFLSEPGDFVGGILHGNEKTVSINIRIDCQEVELSNVPFCRSGKSVLICMESKLFVPGKPDACFALHKKEYRFDSFGLQITQTVEWLKETRLGRCYMAMFPISKRYSDFLLMDGSTELIKLDAASELCRDGVRKVETGTKDQRFTASFAVTKMPDAGNGKQKFLVTDNGGRDYHKMYYMVCSEGTAQAGEFWEAVSCYSLNLN